MPTSLTANAAGLNQTRLSAPAAGSGLTPVSFGPIVAETRRELSRPLLILNGAPVWY